MTIPSEARSNAPFVPSIDMLRLRDMLAVAKEGDMCRYSELSAAIGRDVQGEARHLLHRARLRVQEECGIVFRVEQNTGLVRLADGQVAPVTAEESVTHVRRTVRRGLRRIGCIDYGKLQDGEKVKHNVASAQLGSLHQAVRVKKMREIEQRAVNELPKGLLADTAAHLARKGSK